MSNTIYDDNSAILSNAPALRGRPGGAATETDNASRTITRADLSDAVHRRIGLSRAESADLVETVLDEIFDTIVSGKDVKLSSFGFFLVRSKKERVGRNPKTGEAAPISARRVVTFRASNVLRARVNGRRKISGD
ncbi:MAG: integration host factor subunit alpha [Methylocystis sp.]|nr:integration host factor subunit alpha [Methylocystis sp.]MBI3275261.1 integration host factor subunit alpha [Methylocystis sp.]